MKKKSRIILDNNLRILFLLTKQLAFVDKMLADGLLEIVYCNELIAELLEVISRPTLQKYFTEEEVILIFEIINCYGVIIPLVSNVMVCRDAKDNYLLSLAKDAKADFLLTEDLDLLDLKIFGDTRIVSIAEFK